MKSKAAYTWMARIGAFTWGFAFIHLFKYILDNIYPFWSGSVGLSFFAYLMIFVVWLSYTLFFYFHPYQNKLPRIVYHIIFTINALVFYYVLMSMGEKTYLNLYPLFFTLQLLIYFFLIASMFPALLSFRISVLAGILPGLITYPYIGNIYVDIFLPGVVYLMPLGVFATKKVSFSFGRQRMIPLRQSIDFLRYLFLGLAFYGIFDAYRERFFIAVFILASGPILSYFFILTDKKKHHIKYGILLLGIIFILSAGLYSRISMTYWAAISFCFLTVWEGVYFKKIVEGDLKREQVLSGIALILVIMLYAISPEWIAIISGCLVFLIQFYIIVYVSKRYRKTISLLFGVSLLAWAFVIFASYSDSYKRDFLANHKTRNANPPPSLKVLNLIKDKNTILATNLFPESVVKHFSDQNGLHIIPVDANSSTFLSAIKKISVDYPNAVQLYSLKKMKPYNGANGESYVFEFARLHNIDSIYLYDYDSPAAYHNASESFLLNDTPNAAPLTLDAWYDFAKEFSDWYLDHKYDEYSLNVMKEMATWRDTPVLNRQLARIYGIIGDTSNEIEYRQKIYDRGMATSEDKNLLLELYFLSGDSDRANRMCEELLAADKDNQMIYLEWKYKIIKQQPNRFHLEALANTLRYMGDNLAPDKISQKNNLLQRIQQDLKSNPQWEEIYKKEKNRQENIAFPK
jgi:hypothetical protein